MEKRKYIIRQIDAGDEPIIASGTCPFYTDERELIPPGYTLDYVRNTPNLKNIYVTVEKIEKGE